MNKALKLKFAGRANKASSQHRSNHIRYVATIRHITAKPRNKSISVSQWVTFIILYFIVIYNNYKCHQVHVIQPRGRPWTRQGKQKMGITWSLFGWSLGWTTKCIMFPLLSIRFYCNSRWISCPTKNNSRIPMNNKNLCCHTCPTLSLIYSHYFTIHSTLNWSNPYFCWSSQQFWQSVIIHDDNVQ